MRARLKRYLVWLVALLFGLGGPVMGLVAYRLSANAERTRAAALCAEYFTDRATAFGREIDETVEELSHLRSIFLVESRITRGQFAAYAASITGRHSSIAALQWAPRVTADARDAHERGARAEGLDGYAIRTLNPSAGTSGGVPSKAEYYPVLFVEPEQGNRDVLGLDLSSQPSCLAALGRALRTGEPSLTEPIDLAQAQDHGKGFLALLPVVLSPASAAETPRSQADGFVAMVVRVHEVFREVLDPDGTDRAPVMRFELSDTNADGRPIVLEASATSASNPGHQDWVFSRTFSIGGQEWLLKGRPASAFVAGLATASPAFLGTGVFLLWELLGALGFVAIKQARDVAFRRQTRLVEAALCNLAEGVIVADASGRFVLFNTMAERVIGLGSRDVGVPEWSETYGCFYPDGRSPFPSEQLPLARALDGEESSQELYIRNEKLPQGAWIYVVGTPLRDETGALEGGIAVIRDITAARRADEQLRRSMKQLEDLRYAVDQATLVTMADRAGTIIYVNAKFCEVSGYSEADLLGQNHRILKSGFHPPAFFDGLWRTISSGRVWRGRICDRAKQGRYFWVDTTIVPLMTDGKPDRYLALRTEITEHMSHEAELERLSNAVEQTADAILITNREGIVEYVNPAFESMTGYSRVEAIGQTPRILRSGKQPPEYYERLWGTILAGKVFRGAPVNQRKNGELFHAEQTITPIKDSEGRIVHFVSVIKDVTDRIRIAQHELEMRYASEVQQRLFPIAAPVWAGLDVAGGTVPALATSGDYYDFLLVQDKFLGIVVGDVSGHGLGPALIMAETRAYLHALADMQVDLGDTLTRINAALHADLEENRYVALILAQFDRVGRRLRFVNAGHTPAFHLDRAGSVKAVMESSGPPLGLLPSPSYAVVETPALEIGDIVVFLTDGITEAEDPDGNEFGAEAALDVVRAHRDESARELVGRLQQATRDFAQGAPRQDDVTVVVCKVVEESPGAAA